MQINSEPNVKQEQKLLKIILVSTLIAAVLGAVFFFAGNFLPSTETKADGKANIYTIYGSIHSKSNVEIYEKAGNGDTLKIEKILQIDESSKYLAEKDVIILIDGVEMQWEGNHAIYLGKGAKIILKNKGKLSCLDKPYGAEACVYFNPDKLVSSDGSDAKYSFDDVNAKMGVKSDGLIELGANVYTISGPVNSKENMEIYEKAIDGDTLRIEKILQIDESSKQLGDKDVILLADGVDIQWEGEYALYLGLGAKVFLKNDARLTCNGKTFGADAAIYFYGIKTASSDGGDAKYSFEEVNKVGGVQSGGLAPLPVTLVRFETKLDNGKVLIKWATATEINNDRFEIERSPDTKTWKVIGTVKGNGNSSTIKNYTFTDNPGIITGTMYYRLHQIDYNGANEYSPLSVVDNKKKEKVCRVYPNPANDVINISLNTDDYTLIIQDQNGKIIVSKQVGSDFETIDCKEFPSGIYIVKLENETISESHKIMVKH